MLGEKDNDWVGVVGIGSFEVVKEEMRKKKAHGLVEIPLTGPPVVSATKKIIREQRIKIWHYK